MAKTLRTSPLRSALFGAALLGALNGSPVTAQTELQQLRAEFLAPPAESRPWTWFHVMSGNMSREGITKDLESLANVGVGGIVLFHVTQGISHGPVKFNSPEHLELIEHVAAECERLGLKFSFHNADGWSSTGGPWISPDQSMKRLVWTEQLVSGGAQQLTLQQPMTNEGYYRDIATIAYPALSGEIADSEREPRISSSDAVVNFARVTDGDPNTTQELTVPEGQTGWLQFSYQEPVSVRHLRLANVPVRDLQITLQISDDGENFRSLFAFPKTRILKNEWEIDTAFAAVTGKHFRLLADRSFAFGEVELSQGSRLDNPAAHSTLGYKFGQDVPRPRGFDASAVIALDTVINLTGKMAANGEIRADLPAGQWTVMRFGYTSTGARNVNPSPEGSGLEVDKFDAASFRTHYDTLLAPIIERTRQRAPTALTGVMIDSYEVGGQNWTGGYEELFARAHDGVDLIPWLPIFGGRVVSSGPETSAMFGRIRHFNASLINQNYYGEFARLMERDGLESLIQPYGNGPLDEVSVGAIASIPAGEFWVRRTDLSNLNGAVSAARMYNKPVAAAEAFTAVWTDNWEFDPAFGKKWGDRAWVAGVNQFFFHRFAHQANTHVMPGMTMNRWGSHFDRTQPWWDKGGTAWFTYMARGQHMLRQGHGVADIAMVVGSDSPVECPDKPAMIDVLPRGVEFDCVDTPTLLARSKFEEGRFVLPNGARYQMLWWPHDNPPRADELARLQKAKAAGVPVAMQHLGDDPNDVFEQAGLLPRVSSDGPLPGFTHRRVGERDILFVMNDADKAREFNLCLRVGGKAGEAWHPVTGAISPLAGRLPETKNADGCSQIDLSLAAYESRFLVFDETLAFAPRDVDSTEVHSDVVAKLTDGWSITFSREYGNAGKVSSSSLFDWSQSDNTEIQHFSGKATYRNKVNLSSDYTVGAKAIILELGTVESVASVTINGRELGTVWTAPYQIDISRALRAGENTIEIEVANHWINRLIGDAAFPDTSGYQPEGNVPERDMVEWYSANQLPPDGPRRTWATHYFQNADDPLIPSGLIGPVTIVRSGN